MNQKSDLAQRMENNPPSARLVPVKGALSEASWRSANAKRAMERDRLSPGTRGAR